MLPIHRTIALALLLGPVASIGAQDLDDDWNARKAFVADTFRKAYSGSLPAGSGPAAGSGGPAAPIDEATGQALDVAAIEALLREVVIDLFAAYEEESIGRFMARVDASFAARDRNATEYRAADLPRALRDDFDVLDRIDHTVQVGQALVQLDGRRCQIDVFWSRRAWIQIGGKEWILTNQRTILQFVRDAAGGLGLAAIFGDALFGVSNRKGEVILREGTIDGVAIVEPIVATKTEGVIEKKTTPASTPSVPRLSPTVVRRTFSHDAMIGFLHVDVDSGSTMLGMPFPGDDLFYGGMPFATINDTTFAGFSQLPPPSPTSSIFEVPSVPALLPYSFPGFSLAPSDVGLTLAGYSSSGHYYVLRVLAVSGTVYDIEVFVQTDGTPIFIIPG